MNAQSVAAALPSTVRLNAVVPLALTGAFVAGVGAQLVGPHLADIGDGLGASAAAASWIGTLYAVATFAAVALSPLLARTFGLRRLFVASAVVFAAAAIAAALSTQLPALLVARTVQGLAGGMFGPLAFVAIFRIWGGPRLPLGFALLAFVLLVSANLALFVSAPIVHWAGWRGLFAAQAALAALLVVPGLRWLPASPLNRDSTRTEWVQMLLLGAASAAFIVVASQGARMSGIDRALPGAIAVVGVLLSVAFVHVHRRSPVRVLIGRKLLDRRFGIPIALNTVFRAVSGATVFLLPPLVSLDGAPRLADVAGWLVSAQVLAFPVAWRLMQRVDARVPMAAGLVLLAAGVLSAGYGVSVPLGLALVGAGQMLFLVPALMTGAGALQPEHGPTGTIAFNMTSAGGATLGIAVLSCFVDAGTSLPQLREAFLVLAILLLLATPVVLLLGPSAPRR